MEMLARLSVFPACLSLILDICLVRSNQSRALHCHASCFLHYYVPCKDYPSKMYYGGSSLYTTQYDSALCIIIMCVHS